MIVNRVNRDAVLLALVGPTSPFWSYAELLVPPGRTLCICTAPGDKFWVHFDDDAAQDPARAEVYRRGAFFKKRLRAAVERVCSNVS